jgi:hypothetical protein
MADVAHRRPLRDVVSSRGAGARRQELRVHRLALRAGRLRTGACAGSCDACPDGHPASDDRSDVRSGGDRESDAATEPDPDGATDGFAGPDVDTDRDPGQHPDVRSDADRYRRQRRADADA